MPEVSAVQGRDAQVAIARASAATGVDFDYLLAQAKLESGLDPSAQARTSSASGLYQFIGSTWLETLDRHGSEHGLDWASAAIERSGGRSSIADPSARAQIMAMRFDPNVSALMAAELARDNSAELSPVLGRAPDHAELYLAHFLGAGGARSFLGALRDTPQASAAALFPKPASANRGIFFESGRARSVGEVMDLLRDKVEGAKGAMPGTVSDPGSFDYAYMPASSAFTHAASTYAPTQPSLAPAPAAHAPARRVSMADTLQATFASSGDIGSRASRQIGEAYGKFRAFGL